MPRTLSLVVIALFFAACAGSPQGGPHANHAAHGGGGKSAPLGKVAWCSLEEGKQLAWVQEKPMLVEFYVPAGCHRCELMDAQIYGNEEIARLINERFVPVRIDLTGTMTREEVELGRRYDYQYECLLLFLDAEGAVIEKAGGGRMCFAEFVSPEWFKGYLHHASEAAAGR